MNDKSNNLPGFTAEASLYEASERYRVAPTDVLTVLTVLMAQVLPQQGFLGVVLPPALRCFHDYLGCTNYCSSLSLPTSRSRCYYDCYRSYKACDQIRLPS